MKTLMALIGHQGTTATQLDCCKPYAKIAENFERTRVKVRYTLMEVPDAALSVRKTSTNEYCFCGRYSKHQIQCCQQCMFDMLALIWPRIYHFFSPSTALMNIASPLRDHISPS